MIDCPSCYGKGIKRRRDSSGEWIEKDCEKCDGSGQVLSPELPERQIAVLERIAVALERIAVSLQALEPTS